MGTTSAVRFATFSTSVALAAMSVGGLPAAQAAPLPTVAPVALASVPAVVGSVQKDKFEAKVLRLTNKARKRARTCGDVRMAKAPRVRWSSILATSANEHSADMATNDYFAHDTPSGVSPFTRMRAAGYNYRAAGENIAAGRSLASPKAVVQAWLNSPGHCQVIMNPKYRELGVGRVEGPGKWGIYWTQNFGLRA